MPSTSVAELQQKLYKRMGLDVPEPTISRHPRGPQRKSQPLSRKDHRKAQRVQKKSHIYSRPPATNSTPAHRGRQTQDQRKLQLKPTQPRGQKTSRPVDVHDDDDDETSDDDEDGFDEDILDEDLGSEGAGSYGASPTTAKISSKARERLAQDDAEIEELERKLGIKKGRKSLPQSFKEDGLDELLGDLGPEEETSEDESGKRKRDYDEWLSSKRAKTNSVGKPRKAPREVDDEEHQLDSTAESNSDNDDDEDLDMLDLDEDEIEDDDEDEDDEGSFDGFDSGAEENQREVSRQRENPYIAPTTGVIVAKYVPPSLRQASGSEGEAKVRLRRQVRGQVNRLTDANILSIVQSVEELYQKNARGDVTEILTDSILAQICQPESLPDQFFVLTGGFIAAIYKVIGSSFGSHFVNRVVMDFGQEYEKVTKIGEPSGSNKETSNLMTLLSQLYTFEVVHCKIVFDYMEQLLSELSELNVELLLRICRMAGRLLRKDDAQTLKHVSAALNKQIAQLGYANISVRTKFMVETINDLKNSKPKAKGMDSAVVSEHVSRMKKRLGDLKSQTRRLEGLAPMGMSLQDIESAGTRGKWWLVGASVPVKDEKKAGKNVHDDGFGDRDLATDDEDMDFVLPDYPQKARAQGFSTTTQIAIFTALMSAMNYEHGYQQVMQLGLKKDDQLEIARVLVQCVGSEAQYNEYYALVGKQACSNGRVRFAFQNRLWRIFRGLGESLFGEEAEDEETADGERMKDERRMRNVARFYASLITEGALSLSLLKPLGLPEVTSWTSTFIEWLMISLLQLCRSKGADEDARVDRAFGPARDLPVLAAGVHWTLRKKVRKTKLISSKELKRLERVREKAQLVVQTVNTDE